MAHRILIVDDEPDIRHLIAITLESAGYQLVEAGKGTEALQALERENVDLAILDIMMPDMDGWEVCRQIRSRQQTKNLPVIILTVRNQPLDRVIGIEVVHADDYLTKPFERQQLLEMVQRLLASRISTRNGITG